MYMFPFRLPCRMPRGLGIVLLTVATTAGAADWQQVSADPVRIIKLDSSSLLWLNGKAQAWIAFEPAVRPLWQRWLSDTVAPGSSKEWVEVDCHAHSYRIGELEGLPRQARHLGKAQAVLPGSDEEQIVQWLCHG